MVEPEDRWLGWIYDVPKKILLLSGLFQEPKKKEFQIKFWN